jgi:hypothetical protein
MKFSAWDQHPAERPRPNALEGVERVMADTIDY